MAVTNEKHHTAGQTFIQGVLAKLPEEKRAKALELFTGEDVDPAIETLGEGAMLRSDYSKSHNALGAREQEIQQHWTKLNTWYASKKQQLDQAETLQAELNTLKAQAGQSGAGDPDGAPDPSRPAAAQGGQTPVTRDQLKTLGLDPDQIVTREQLAQALNTTERGMLAFYGEANPIGIEHYKTFGEVLDIGAVYQHPKIQELGFKACYLDLHKTQFAELAKAAQEKHDKDVAERAIADYQKETAGQQGFPIPGRAMPSSFTSPLDSLEASMRTPAQPASGQPSTASAAPGPGHTNLADDNALVDRAVEQFLTRAQELGRPIARM
jgi:hypothetical protein